MDEEIPGLECCPGCDGLGYICGFTGERDPNLTCAWCAGTGTIVPKRAREWERLKADRESRELLDYESMRARELEDTDSDHFVRELLGPSGESGEIIIW
jgi:hypothetical protein